MTEDKPLHVRVAEALGCRILPCSIGGWICGCDGGDHQENGLRPQAGYEPMAHYDTDWSATGPLIEKYGITLTCDPYDSEWVARKGDLFVDEWWTPLPAVCHLLIYLKGAGKL